MEPFLHFKEDVFEDQSAFLVSFCSSGQPPARQIPEQVKICSEIKELCWCWPSLIFSGSWIPIATWSLQPKISLIFMSLISFSLLVSRRPNRLPLHLTSCILMLKDRPLGFQKTPGLLAHHCADPLQQILEWLKPALPSPPPKTRPCNHKASFSSPSLVKAVYDRCLLKLLYNAVAWPDVLVHQWQVSFSFTCTVIERPFFLLAEVACFQPPPTQM